MPCTPKSALLTYLETKGAMTTPDEIAVKIIDAAFFLHLHRDLSANFGGKVKYLYISKATNKLVRCSLQFSFKTSVVEFLVSAWSSSEYALLFEGKLLFANCGNFCYKFMSILGKAVRIEEWRSRYPYSNSHLVFRKSEIFYNQNSRHRLSYQWSWV